MGDETEVDLKSDEIFMVHASILFEVVCAPRSWDKDRVQLEANTKFGGPGTELNEWVITSVDGLPESWGSENPLECSEEDRCHWLLNC